MGLFNFSNRGVARDPVDDKFWEAIFDTRKRMLSQYGMEVLANFISRSFMALKVATNDEIISRKLNVAPNKNQNAAEFWRDIIYKLIMDNEVLVILNDSKDLLIADSFTMNDFANFQNVYSGVSVGNYNFQRSFVSDEVWHLKLNTEDWRSAFTRTNEELDNLYVYVINNVKLTNQIRATVSVDANSALNKTEAVNKNIGEFITKIRNSMNNNPIALLPELNGIKYDEKTQSYQSGGGIDEISRLKQLVIEDAAAMLGVPTAMIFGSQADTSGVSDQYRENVLIPNLLLLQSELRMKLSDSSLVLSFDRDLTIVKNAEQIDKLISSGFISRNALAALFNISAIEGGDVITRTKNYETIGGETND